MIGFIIFLISAVGAALFATHLGPALAWARGMGGATAHAEIWINHSIYRVVVWLRRGVGLGPDATVRVIEGALGFASFVTLETVLNLPRSVVGGAVRVARGRRQAKAEEADRRAGRAPRQVSQVRFNSRDVLPTELETRHLLAVGGTGTGKSQILRSAALAARTDGCPAVVPAIEASLFEALYDPGQDVVLNPYDQRSAQWSPLAEMRDEGDDEMLASILIPPGGGENQEWREHARNVLAACLHYVWQRGGTNGDIAWLINVATPADLKPVFEGRAAAALLQYGAEKMLGSARGIAGSIAKPLAVFDPAAGCGAWSVSDWVDHAVAAQDAGEAHGWLWITAHQRQRAAMLPVLSAIAGLAIKGLLGAPEREDRRVYLLIDELGMLPPISDVKGALSQGRKYGLRTFAALQSVEQIRDRRVYGREGAASLLSNFSTKALFRQGDPESADYAERTIGKLRIKRRVRQESEGTSASMGFMNAQPGTRNSSRSTSEQHAIEPAVLASTFLGLPDLRCYLVVSGHGFLHGPDRKPRQVKVNYVPLEPEHRFFKPKRTAGPARVVTAGRGESPAPETAGPDAPAEEDPRTDGAERQASTPDEFIDVDELFGE